MPLMTFKTPERVCWDDEASGLTFFVVALPDTTAKWRETPNAPLDDIVYSHDVFRFKKETDGICRVASNEELMKSFKTNDSTSVVKSILSAGTVQCKEFELDVEAQSTTAMNAATHAANVATEAATNALEGVKGYLSSFW
ncbi:hypothetical protein GGI25_001883 [Coemansia spiralis]|uniref:Ribosome maturation protein SDO1/SBDS N-terminal domain-containing protein n=2 Tax=Coemansia TaxID=4863 RepID=A0A9W8KZH4_9FUNG|nr:hypothetical protein BX070DRAFT_252582 [Coemansia spiralis]KAJ1993317.1 hypothetical protein EDC05_002181 [Coemansia umbellata]KAJ2623535.1 hypothetical protein GGI26_002374 [Coemansia sp. RSA 1358]KAJ2678894.1 hypothetical protein GGI25_001883 [Coemansia spiralis]